MKTAITELFGIRHPILNAGMDRVALPEMVAAVSNAGGLGVFGAGSGRPEETRNAIREIRRLTDKPFGANAPLAMPNGRENAEVFLEERVPVINYSMGRGDWIVKRASEYGGKVVASVTSVHFAQRAQDQGAHAVIAAGHEAAGHVGEVTTFVLIPRLAEVLNVPIIAAGGIANGAGLLAALALGASAVSIGTRFAVTAEGNWHDNYKKKALELEISDTLYSERFDGFPARQLRTPGAERLLATSVNPIAVFLQSFGIAQELGIPYPALLWQVASKGPRHIANMVRMARTLQASELARAHGDMERGKVAGGMSVGLVHDIPTSAEIVERIMSEAVEIQRRLAACMQ